MAMLDVAEVSVRFGGLQALTEVDLDVAAGHVTGLIGPNGAGKTTLFNVITGLQPPHRGRIFLNGREITGDKAHRRARLGLARTFQRLEVFGTMTVRENVLVAAETARSWSAAETRPARVADELVERVGLAHLADARVETLPTGSGRLVELARALASRPKVLLLDEPSSGLNSEETAAMGSLLSDLAGAGLAVLLVEHDMGFVMGTCARVHVLDFGRIIAAGTPAEMQTDTKVRAAYLGESDGQQRHRRPGGHVGNGSTPTPTITLPAEPAAPRTAPVDGPVPVLEMRDIRAGYGRVDVLHGVTLVVRPGEVVALLGPNGAGKSTTLKVASGQLAPTHGDVLLCGHRVTGSPPDGRARAGMCTIPEGRGIFPNLTVTENLRMATYAGVRYRQVEERAFARFPILAERHRQVAGTLSGGEQQMLAMARALVTEPALLMLDELSLGLAPLVVEQLYEIVAGIADEGISILIVEQFVHEVLRVADTAAVMLHGAVAFSGAPADLTETLSAAYLGAGSTN